MEYTVWHVPFVVAADPASPCKAAEKLPHRPPQPDCRLNLLKSWSRNVVEVSWSIRPVLVKSNKSFTISHFRECKTICPDMSASRTSPENGSAEKRTRGKRSPRNPFVANLRSADDPLGVVGKRKLGKIYAFCSQGVPPQWSI